MHVWINLDAMATFEPANDGFAQLRLADCGWVAADGANGVNQRLANERRGWLVRIADRKIVQDRIFSAKLIGQALEAIERITAQLCKCGVRCTHRLVSLVALRSSGRDVRLW